MRTLPYNCARQYFIDAEIRIGFEPTGLIGTMFAAKLDPELAQRIDVTCERAEQGSMTAAHAELAGLGEQLHMLASP